MCSFILESKVEKIFLFFDIATQILGRMSLPQKEGTAVKLEKGNKKRRKQMSTPNLVIPLETKPFFIMY